MEIKITSDPSDVPGSEWEAWVLSHPEGTVFHSPGMYETFLGTMNYEPVLLLALNEVNRLTGVLLAVIQREPGLIMERLSARSIIFGGPVSHYLPSVKNCYQMVKY